MNIAAVAIQKKAVTIFAIALLGVSGIMSFFSLGWLEDPEFTIKSANISTVYPGASPLEVELEVTDRIELAIQEMPQVKNIESLSRAGLSIVKVDIKDSYTSRDIPQIWDELRRKVRNIETTLPPGAGRPDIGDDFGDVFGLFLAITADGFSYADLYNYAKLMRKELNLVNGVARVDLWGVQDPTIYVEFSQTQASSLGISSETIVDTLSRQNMVVDAGHVDVDRQRVRIAPTGAFASPEDIADLTIRATVIDALGDPAQGASPDALLRLGDIATVRRGYVDPPMAMMRHNDLPAIGMGLSVVAGGNVVDMGAAVDARLAELASQIPAGIEIHRISWQSDLVTNSINEFMISLAQAVGIVLVVLALAMGWQMGVIIGTALILTILGTFTVMAVMGIDLHRMSLGALVVALGMMVDNSIVIADGIYVRLQQGMDRVQAAVESCAQATWPLFGATLVAVMAFYPIVSAESSAGEYCVALFQVVAIALLLSWILSLTLTPIQCLAMLKVKDGEGGEAYGGRFYNGFRSMLAGAIRMRWLTVGAMVGLLVIALGGFTHVKQLFFPASNRAQFMVDYWMPEGTRIQATEAGLQKLEEKLLEDPRVTSVSAFVGQGPLRFYLPVDPEKPYTSYAQLIVNVADYREIPEILETYHAWTEVEVPDAQVRWREYGLGPSDTWKFEARFSGLAEADPDILRSLGNQGLEILRDHPMVEAARLDWRERTNQLVPEYDAARGRWANVDRDEMAASLKRSFDGVQVGQYREGDELIPIVARNTDAERENVVAIDTVQIAREFSSRTVPVAQVVRSIDYQWQDPLIWRWDRRRALQVQAEPARGFTNNDLMASVRAEFEAIPLPPGYTLEFDGEYQSSREAQESLKPGIIPAVVIMLLIIVALFNNYRTPLVIVLTIPFAVIGITAGLLLFSVPFGFVALLGAMSLSGMMIKNAIVLLDQIKLELKGGKDPYRAVVDSAVSRLRPVLLAAATTVLGVIPLLQDVFWVGLAVTVMAGLTFGTVLTMILVPVLYAILYRIPSPGGSAKPAPAEPARA
ncbi:MAG: efflux RND transporter permease subunit [Pseudomonadota bacterium]